MKFLKYLYLIIFFLPWFCQTMEQALIIPNVPINQTLTIEDLPEEIKAHIILALTQFDNIDDVISSIRALSETNKEFNRLVNDKQVTNILIDLLSNRQFKDPETNKVTEYNKLDIALKMQTPGALDWLNAEENKEIIDELLSSPFQKGSLLLDIITHNNIVLIDFLLQKDPTLINDLFFYATTSKNIDLMKRFIEQGANVNKPFFAFGYTPLHIAAYNLDADAIELLLAHGGDANIKDIMGEVPLVHAIKRIRNKGISLNEPIKKIIQLLAQNVDQNDLNQAWNIIASANPEVAQLLLDQLLINLGTQQ